MAGATDEDVDEVRRTIDELLDAFNAGDAARVEALVSEELGLVVIGTAPDERSTGEQLLAALREIPGGGDVRGTQDDVTVHIHGDVAWTEGTGRFVRDDGAECPVRVTRVLVREGGRWKFVQIHDSIAAPDDDLFTTR